MIQTDTLELQSDDCLIPAYVAYPDSHNYSAVIVVIQEVFGVNKHIQGVTRRIAEEGYVAIAPHIYHRQVINFSVGYSEPELALGRQYKVGTRAAELLSDVQAALTYGQKHFQVSSQAGCIGFCFGGHVAYLAATLPDIVATASFYGAGIVTSTPGGGAPTLTRTPEIKGTLYGFFGQQDPLISSEEVDAIETALQAASVEHKIFRYPAASHGFFCDQRDSYNADAADAAWKAVKSLFKDKLSPA